jgi:two-component system sensor histidine kinase ChiS
MGPTGDTGLVLIVDDYPDICEMLVRMVRAMGLRAESVTGGRQALEFMRQRRPSLVLLDYTMPDMNGLEVLRQKAADPSIAAVPVIINSAYVGEIHDEAMRLGVRDCVQKDTLGPDNLKKKILEYV